MNKRAYNIKAKLLFPLSVLTVILLIFGFLVIKSQYEKMNSLEKLNERITLSRKISIAIHSLQKERGLSSGFLANENGKFLDELLEQRTKSDHYLFILKEQPNDIYDQKFIVDIINKIKKLRLEVDKRVVKSTDVIEHYSKLTEILLEQIVKISKSSHIPKITQFLIANINLLYLKEFGGIERAEGMVIFSEQKVDRKHLVRFTNLIAMQRQSERMFLQYACKSIKREYLFQKHQAYFQDVEYYEGFIQYGAIESHKLDPKQWYELITKKLNILDKISEDIERDTKKRIAQELKSVRFLFYVVSFLVFVGIFIFIVSISIFMRLAKEEQRLRLVSQKYIISSITDLNGKIIDVSDAFCEISGYSREELIGKPHNIVRHPDMPKEVFAELWSTIKKGNSWQGKVKNKTKDGGFYWVYANVEPLYDSKGKIDSYISIRLDITQSELLLEKVQKAEEKRKVAYEMMQQQARLAQMGEMLSMIAHQWRQPLSAITAATGVIELKAKLGKLDNETAIDLSRKIKEFSIHLSSTIDDFRGFFKSKKMQTVTSFEKMVQEVHNIVKSSLENNQIELQLEVVSSKEFQTYEGEVKQVLLNLIKNSEDALKECDYKRKIKIIIEDEKFVIIDNAGGIPEEILPKIFDPYFSTKEKKDGTGLGLYMSRIIIQDHCKGELMVENVVFDEKEVQKGAQFTIILGDDNEI